MRDPAQHRRPRIGLTLDAEPAGGYSVLPWYALRENYFGALVRAGGLPVALPHEVELAGAYLELIDGLVVTGGAFDVDPALYGAMERHPTVLTKDRRTAFELEITRLALERDLPVLGICGGQQLLNVVLGGDLIQHIPDAVPDCLAHEQPNPRTEAGHDVVVVPGSRLHAIVGVERFPVNSAHHQAAGAAGPGVVVSGRAPDGVVEAIEMPERRFVIGVQWHPEYRISPADQALLEAFVAAAGSPLSGAEAGERIAKRIARSGLCSRREAERLIEQKRVAVDGRVIESPALDVAPDAAVMVDGEPLPAVEPPRLFRYHKPRGLLTTERDPEGRPTIYDRLPADLPRLMPVGRLDFNSEGLLLLTNDGGLKRRLELPATGWLRRYRVRVHGAVDQARLDTLQDGVEVDGMRYGPIRATLDREQGSNAWLTLALREGKNREVRRVLAVLGLEVTRLIRSSFGPFHLGSLAPGAVEEVKGKVMREQLGQLMPGPAPSELRRRRRAAPAERA